MRRVVLLFAVVGAAVLLATGVALAQQERTTAAEDSPSFKGPDGKKFASNKLIVKLRDGATTEDLRRINSRNGASIDKEDLAPNLVPDLHRVSLPSTLGAQQAVGRYEAFKDVVEYAEVDYIQYANKVANDPYSTNGSLWGLNKIQAPAAWDSITGKNVGGATTYNSPLVAVIDEGVQIGHSDFKDATDTDGDADNIWTNYDEVGKTSGVDDSPNSNYSKIDDFNGWDENQNNNSVYDGTSDDHGTHVADTIGARGNNNTGVTGVNWHTDIAVCKFLGPAGGYTSDAIACLDYVVFELGARVSNNSWGGGGYSQGLLDAIKRARDWGHIFVVAAGNGGSDSVGDDNDSKPSYPSSYNVDDPNDPNDWDNIIAVASTTSTDAKSGFSNYGLKSVDLGAPGSGIYSTVPGRKNASSYASYSGTSMATPHVTGTVALIWAKDPKLTARQVKDLILQNVDGITSLDGKTVSGGRLNAFKAVQNAGP